MGRVYIIWGGKPIISILQKPSIRYIDTQNFVRKRKPSDLIYSCNLTLTYETVIQFYNATQITTNSLIGCQKHNLPLSPSYIQE